MNTEHVRKSDFTLESEDICTTVIVAFLFGIKYLVSCIETMIF
jgi:hypothetical protein